MRVKPNTYKKLVAFHKGKIIKIPNMILRKQAPIDKQNKNLTKNSVCIVCNFRFMENKIKWSSKVKAICHPFRNDSIFPEHIDRYLLSESDFCDKLVTPIKKDNRKYKYDFVYFTLNSREGTRSKGIYALSLLDEVAGDLGLKGLVVNYAVRETEKHKGTIYDRASKKVKNQMNSFKNFKIINSKLDSEKVCDVMMSSRFVFIPSDADASPRIMVEPLVRNRPIVVSSAIYGGWKYVNDSTGSFFDAPTIEEFVEDDYKKDYAKSLRSAIEKVLAMDIDGISRSFYNDYGFAKSAKRLAKIINKITGKKYKAVAYKEWEKQLMVVGKGKDGYR